MEHVTFKTAPLLAHLGFQQPENIECGQVWVTPEGDELLTITSRFDYGKAIITWDFFAINLNKAVSGVPEDSVKKHFVFAPTATDILKELGEDWKLSAATLPINGVYWTCINSIENYGSTDKNPAECAAMAWLQIHEKK